MEYITSRGFALPESGDDLSKRFWFNLWRVKLWPYKELVVGDILYWYESPRKHIVWKSCVVDVDRFFYTSKQVLKARLTSRFGDFDTAQPYFTEAPEQGYCLAWKVAPLQKMALPKPDNLRFPGQGWLRVSDEILHEWLLQEESMDDVTLDEIVSDGSLVERIRELNTSMAQVSPERVCSIVTRTIRRDTQLIKALKQLCEYRCQFPGCGTRIPMRNGGFYVEVAHIQPVREGGQSVIGNLLVLCPNHHKEFDHGDLKIEEQTFDKLRGELNGKAFEIHIPGAGFARAS